MTIFTSFAGFMEKILPKLVTTDTDQTIGGLKSFSSIPTTTASQGSWATGLTRKDYVDAQTPAGSAPLRSVSLGTVDLNTLGAPEAAGFYRQENDSNTSLARNYPINRSGSLLIMQSAGGTTQTYITYDECRVYTRAYYQATGFTQWYETTATRPVSGVGNEVKIFSSAYPLFTLHRPEIKLSMSVDASGDFELRGYTPLNVIKSPHFRVGMSGTVTTNGDVIATGNMSCATMYGNTLVSNTDVYAGSGSGARFSGNGNIYGTIWQFAGGATNDLFAYIAQGRTYTGLGSSYMLSGGGTNPYVDGSVYTIPGAPGTWQANGGFYFPGINQWGSLLTRIT